MNVSKKLVSCMLGVALVCQPIFFNGADSLSMVAEAHSGHHADRHHSGSSAGSYDPYYYCNGHEAHLHDGGVCPYADSSDSYYYCDGHEAHLHDGGVCPYADSSDSYYYCDGHEAHLHDGGVCPYASTVSTDPGAYASGAAQGSVSSLNTVLDTSGRSVELSTGDTIALSRDLIRIVQDTLNQKGYDCGDPDGMVGTKTKEAIADYLAEADDADTDSLIVAMVAKGLGLR